MGIKREKRESAVLSESEGSVAQNAKRFQLAIELREDETKRRPMDEEIKEFLDDHNVSPSLHELLREHSYARRLGFGRTYVPTPMPVLMPDASDIVLYRVNALEEENKSQAHRACIKVGLLVVGSGLSGDPLVIDLVSGVVGFVDHEELWGTDPRGKKNIARGAFAPTPVDLGTFILAAQLLGDASSNDGPATRFPVDAPGASALHAKDWDAIERPVVAFEASKTRARTRVRVATASRAKPKRKRRTR